MIIDFEKYYLKRRVLNMPKWLENFIKRLEEANKKNLGSGKLDCCDLNKQTKPINNSSKNK
jgi:hypothetical protein